MREQYTSMDTVRSEDLHPSSFEAEPSRPSTRSTYEPSGSDFLRRKDSSPRESPRSEGTGTYLVSLVACLLAVTKRERTATRVSSHPNFSASMSPPSGVKEETLDDALHRVLNCTHHCRLKNEDISWARNVLENKLKVRGHNNGEFVVRISR